MRASRSPRATGAWWLHPVAAFCGLAIGFGIAPFAFPARPIPPVPVVEAPRPTLRPVDHPRCFAEGVVETEVFEGCPDTLPSMRSI